MSLPSAPGPPPSWWGPGLPDDPFPDRVEPSEEELAGLCPDPFAGPPDGEDAWLADLSLAELDALAGQWEAEHGPPVDDVLGAGFARDVPGDPALGYAAGGPLDGRPQPHSGRQATRPRPGRGGQGPHGVRLALRGHRTAVCAVRSERSYR